MKNRKLKYAAKLITGRKFLSLDNNLVYSLKVYTQIELSLLCKCSISTINKALKTTGNIKNI
jgi:hypothetical protein